MEYQFPFFRPRRSGGVGRGAALTSASPVGRVPRASSSGRNGHRRSDITDDRDGIDFLFTSCKHWAPFFLLAIFGRLLTRRCSAARRESSLKG